ncbi:MAG TPA: hypothetical protein DCF68_15265 [Cyanothece sp. UBA12306]|nr:hypothetical protein [Cyanothece sp. UBA12306]
MKETRLRLTVLGLFIDDDQVLMIHQMTFPEPDCWDLPGGGLEPHEPLLEGLKREVKEETSIENFTVEKLLTVAESFFPEGENKILHTVNIIYQCSVYPKPYNLKSDEAEIGPKGIQWIPIDSLTQEICSSRSWQALQTLKS